MLRPEHLALLRLPQASPLDFMMTVLGPGGGGVQMCGISHFCDVNTPTGAKADTDRTSQHTDRGVTPTTGLSQVGAR